MIYFDNAATTLFKPEEVYLRSNRVFRDFSANAGRSGHLPSMIASEIIYNSRQTTAKFLGIPESENVIFTFSCTDALNMVIQGLFRENDHIITTVFEHNSVLRPLEYMKKHYNIQYDVIEPNEEGYITESELKKHQKINTKAIIINYVSNVTGHVQPLKEISSYAKENNLLLIADCAQAAGTQDIKNIDADYICCAGHKGLYGPQGIGILGIKNNASAPKPLRFGGTGSMTMMLDQPEDLPEYLESGTQSVQNIAALESGILYVSNNTERIKEHEIALAKRLVKGLKDIKNVSIYAPKQIQSGVMGFNIDHIDSYTLSEILDKNYKICIRGGLHCAPLLHKYLKTDTTGIARVSFSIFNSDDEVDYLLNVIEFLSKK